MRNSSKNGYFTIEKQVEVNQSYLTYESEESDYCIGNSVAQDNIFKYLMKLMIPK